MDPSARTLQRPKRPLSAYNLFFAAERRKILEERRSRPDGSTRPSLSKIGFQCLTKGIADRWNAIDAATKDRFEEVAKVHKARFKREMAQYKQMKRYNSLRSRRAAQAQARSQRAVNDEQQGLISMGRVETSRKNAAISVSDNFGAHNSRDPDSNQLLSGSSLRSLQVFERTSNQPTIPRSSSPAKLPAYSKEPTDRLSNTTIQALNHDIGGLAANLGSDSVEMLVKFFL